MFSGGSLATRSRRTSTRLSLSATTVRVCVCHTYSQAADAHPLTYPDRIHIQQTHTHTLTHTHTPSIAYTYVCTNTHTLTGSLHKGHVEVKSQQRLSKKLSKVSLHCAGDGLSVPLKLVSQVNRVQLASFDRVFDQFGCLGEDPRFPVDPFFIQTWRDGRTNTV